ncbi:MAG: hypothetical protein KDD50_15885, partial [Bdellovibrionales bacterium]|nr:hypothetical protein [Bdellovibrionales bacterium]
MYTKAILLASVFLACHAATAKVSMVKVYSGKIPTGNGYTIKLEIPKDWDDPGAYTKVTLYQKGKSVFSLNELQASDLKNVDNFPENTKNIGKYLKTFPLSFKSRSQHVLAMSNWMGGSSDDELILVSLFNHTPKVIFQKSVKVLFIKDFDGDGYYDILKAGGRGEPNG